MTKINSAVIIDYCDIDNFVNLKTLEYYGATDIRAFKKAQEALTFLTETDVKFQLIIVGNNMPVINGFDFIDKFREYELQKKHGAIILLSAFFSPIEEERAIERNVNFLLKPLVIEHVIAYL